MKSGYLLSQGLYLFLADLIDHIVYRFYASLIMRLFWLLLDHADQNLSLAYAVQYKSLSKEVQHHKAEAAKIRLQLMHTEENQSHSVSKLQHKADNANQRCQNLNTKLKQIESRLDKKSRECKFWKSKAEQTEIDNISGLNLSFHCRIGHVWVLLLAPLN